MDSKTIFLNTCLNISNDLAPFGFKPTQKGQILKKIADDKDMFYEIYFQSSTLNSASNIAMLPHISIYSKALKKWLLEQFNINNNGLIFTAQLGHITPKNAWTQWNLAGLNADVATIEIVDLIKREVFPIFDIFKTKENAIDFLKSNGTQFNAHTEKSLFPLDFMLRFAKKEDAQSFFTDFVQQCSYRGKIISLYKALEIAENINLNHSEFWFANKVKLAFVNGLRLE